MNLICHLCSQPILEPSKALRRVHGWERKSRGVTRRGGSDIILREHTDEWACPTCIAMLTIGLNPEQETLL